MDARAGKKNVRLESEGAEKGVQLSVDGGCRQEKEVPDHDVL